MLRSFSESCANKVLTITQGFGTLAVVTMADLEVVLKLALLLASGVYTVVQIRLALNQLKQQKLVARWHTECRDNCTTECKGHGHCLKRTTTKDHDTV